MFTLSHKPKLRHYLSCDFHDPSLDQQKQTSCVRQREPEAFFFHARIAFIQPVMTSTATVEAENIVRFNTNAFTVFAEVTMAPHDGVMVVVA